MASDIPMGEPDADLPPEVVGLDSKQEEPAAAGATADQDPAGVAATEDAAEGTNGVTAGDETVVDEVSLLECAWKMLVVRPTNAQGSRSDLCSVVLLFFVR